MRGGRGLLTQTDRRTDRQTNRQTPPAITQTPTRQVRREDGLALLELAAQVLEPQAVQGLRGVGRVHVALHPPLPAVEDAHLRCRAVPCRVSGWGVSVFWAAFVGWMPRARTPPFVPMCDCHACWMDGHFTCERSHEHACLPVPWPAGPAPPRPPPATAGTPPVVAWVNELLSMA